MNNRDIYLAILLTVINSGEYKQCENSVATRIYERFKSDEAKGEIPND